ncbi:MAG: 3-hydroxyacyl-ACP dehydratase FabZ [Fibrobacter sp.]|nr:3-hydroxyacyl-ACP dehydratase FabZ [Fibrobacter sp.]
MSLLESLPKPEKEGAIVDFAGILELLPHRYPFLLVDKVISLDEETKTIVCQKNVSFNEPFFSGHFPQEPVMPGVLQVEAMAQAGCVMMYLLHEENKDKRPAFMGVDNCRFRKPVRPGDILTIEATETRYRRGLGTLNARVSVDGVLVSECTIMAMMV